MAETWDEMVARRSTEPGAAEAYEAARLACTQRAAACPQCAACDACDGSCGVCPYADQTRHYHQRADDTGSTDGD